MLIAGDYDGIYRHQSAPFAASGAMMDRQP
jgi:hypothetical protein